MCLVLETCKFTINRPHFKIKHRLSPPAFPFRWSIATYEWNLPTSLLIFQKLSFCIAFS